MNYKLLNSQIMSLYHSPTSSLLRRWWSQDLCTYICTYHLCSFSLPGMCPRHQLFNGLTQIHHSCLGWNITYSINPSSLPFLNCYPIKTPNHKLHFSFRNPAQFVITYFVVYLFMSYLEYKLHENTEYVYFLLLYPLCLGTLNKYWMNEWNV